MCARAIAASTSSSVSKWTGVRSGCARRAAPPLPPGHRIPSATATTSQRPFMRKNTSTPSCYQVGVSWPITWDDIVAARRRIAPHLSPTPLRHYAPLDEAVGQGIRVLVKHENHQPPTAFKARNAISLLTALEPAQKPRGVVAAP